jgi:protein gp37
MGENSGISWTHNTLNFWRGCQKVAPECAKCYISRPVSGRVIAEFGTGKVVRAEDWNLPWKWELSLVKSGLAKRIFTCSYSDFFHIEADGWRAEAWRIIHSTPHLVWLILTKRPELIEKRLPHNWGDGYPNVWLGVSVGCKQRLNGMDTLRRIPAALRWVSCEPLLEDIAADMNLEGFGWVVVGGESGTGSGLHHQNDEYLWNPTGDWKEELKDGNGRRTMLYKWAAALRDKVKAADLPFMFKQVTAPRPGFGYNALDGVDWHEFPQAPNGLEWAPRQTIPDKYTMTDDQWQVFKHCEGTYPFASANIAAGGRTQEL